MKLSVVIPTHARYETLEQLLFSIKQQNFASDEFEVVVVANLKDSYYSKPHYQEAIAGLQVRVEFLGELGVNKARNLGIKKAKGDLVVLLDDDCVLIQTDFLSEVDRWHMANPKAVAIGGTYTVSADASPLDWAYNCVARQWQALDYFGDYRSSRLVGGNVSYKRQMLLDSGEKFNEKIQFGGTEAEFHQRLNARGFETLFIESLIVLHQTRLTDRALVEKAFMQAQGHLKYNIEAGFSDQANRTYQNKRILRARELARSELEYEETVNWLNLYDWAYNYTCANPTVSPGKLYSRSKAWLNQARRKGLEASL